MCLFSSPRAALLGALATLLAAHAANVPSPLDRTPLAFTPSASGFAAQGNGIAVELDQNGARLLLGNNAATTAVLPIQVNGSTRTVKPEAVDPLPGKANFLIGNDPKQWRTGLATYAKVAYRGVLPGIDLIYYGDSKRLEYDFIVAPLADPHSISIETGKDWKVSVQKDGSLLIRNHSGSAKVEFAKPVTYQLAADGRRIPIASSYARQGDHRFGFRIASSYDKTRPLVIDPVLTYGTYLGGSRFDEGSDIAIDGSGNVYVTGRTLSTSFPITSGAPVANCGSQGPDGSICYTTLANNGGNLATAYAFITKLNPQGTQVVYSTYYGGRIPVNVTSSIDQPLGTWGRSIAVDAAGNAYIAGETFSQELPVTSNAAQPAKSKVLRSRWPGACGAPIADFEDPYSKDGFVAKLDPTGRTLLYSTYLGGAGNEATYGIAVNAQNEIYVVGTTYSRKGNALGNACPQDVGLYAETGYPTTANAAYPELIDRVTELRGSFTKFNASGAIVYSTYLGAGRKAPATGPDVDSGRQGAIVGYRVAVDAAGAAYITGWSQDEFFGGGCVGCRANSHRNDAFLIKIDPSSGAIVYGPTLIGGSGHDYGIDVALDASGNAYVTGSSQNPENTSPAIEFPVTAGVYQTARPSLNNECPILVKYSPTGSRLFSTFFCGNARSGFGYAVAVDPTTQTPVLTGMSDDQLPLVNNFSFNAAGGTGAYLARLNSTGTSVLFSSFIGKSSGQNDNASAGFGVVVDSQMNAYVAGGSPNALGTLTTAGSYSPAVLGGGDAFISKIDLKPAPPVLSTLSTSPNPPVAGQALTITLNGSGFDTSSVEVVLGGGSTVIANSAITTKTITQLVFTTTLSAGTFTVAARNSGSIGTPSNTLSLTVPASSANPTVSSISPSTATAGSSTFTIAGTNFNPSNVQVEIGGAVIANALLTTKTATQLVFTTTLQAGVYAVLVRNGSGGTASNSVSLTINGVVSGQGSHFVPITPCRAADTRSTTAIPGGSFRNFTFGVCSVPSNATAVSMNITLVPSGPFGYLATWPAGQPQPMVSTMNSLDGRIKANSAIVGLGAGNAVSVFVTETAHIIIDVNGYFVPAGTPGALAFYPAAPCRIVDTRATGGGGIIAAQGTRRITSSCLPSTAQAYSLNVTVVPPAALGFLTLWPDGSTQPLASTLNNLTGTVVANAALLRAGTGGAFNAYVTDASHLIADLNGYFAPPGSPGALAFYPSTPCRIFDTRNAAGAFGGPAMGADATRAFTVPASACSIPSTAQAYVTNATVIPSGVFGFLTMWPGGQSRPTVSTLNAVDGALTSNAAIVPAGPNGVIQLYTSNSVHMLLDISGYFAP